MKNEKFLTSSSWLRDIYAERRRKNSNFSLRAFARQLGVPASRLSDVFNDNRLMTPAMGKKIADRLELSPNQEKYLLDLIKKDYSTENLRPRRDGSMGEYQPLQDDIFKAIADWYHFAILELTRLEDFSWDYGWMSTKLNISAIEARQATERMIRLGLLEERGKKLKLSKKSFTTTHDIPSSALRASHRQSLRMAINNLDETSVAMRDITSITIATNPDNLSEAKRLIKNFRRRLSKVLEKGKKTQVYNINVQLVPVTREVKDDQG